MWYLYLLYKNHFGNTVCTDLLTSFYSIEKTTEFGIIKYICIKANT